MLHIVTYGRAKQTWLIPTTLDVCVALVYCVLPGYLAGGNRGAEGIAKEHSPP